MNDNNTTLADLKHKFNEMIEVRDWHQFHTPKNLAMSIGIEAAELGEHFVWSKDDEQDAILEKRKKEISHEVADIAFNLFQFCNQCDIDLAEAVEEKLALIDKKYPADICKGSLERYEALKFDKSSNPT